MCARCVVPRNVVPPVPPSSACVAAAAAQFVQPRASRPRHAGDEASSLKSPHSTVNEASSRRACRSAAAAHADAWACRAAASAKGRWHVATTTGRSPRLCSVATRPDLPSSNTGAATASEAINGSFEKIARPSRRSDPSCGWMPRRRAVQRRWAGSASSKSFCQRGSKNHSWRHMTSAAPSVSATKAAWRRPRASHSASSSASR